MTYCEKCGNTITGYIFLWLGEKHCGECFFKRRLQYKGQDLKYKMIDPRTMHTKQVKIGQTTLEGF